MLYLPRIYVYYLVLCMPVVCGVTGLSSVAWRLHPSIQQQMTDIKISDFDLQEDVLATDELFLNYFNEFLSLPVSLLYLPL